MTAAVVLLAAHGVAATAQPSPANVAALDVLVAEALANSPDVGAAAEAVRAAQARPAQARALADPTLSVLYTNDAWRPTLGEREMTTLGLMASQTLPWPGKRELRAAVARQDAQQAQERLERVRLSVAAGVKRAYWGLALARGTLSLLAEQADVARDTEAAARARYAVGQGSQQDVLRAQVELTRLEQRRAEQEAEALMRAAELNRLLGRPADASPPSTEPLALRPVAVEPATLLANAEARSPELRAAAAVEERERLAARLAGAEFKPDITLQAAYMNRGGLDPMWQAGVGINLPIARERRHAALEEAEARRRAAGRQQDAVRAQLRFRTQERTAQLNAAETLARLYADGLIPQGRLAFEAAIASYQAGRVPFLAVLEALSTLYADRLGQLAVLAAHERIQAAIEEVSLDAMSELPSAGGAMSAAPSSFGATPTSGERPGAASPAAAAMPSMGQ